jgi:uncharacterized membrane protein YgcG
MRRRLAIILAGSLLAGSAAGLATAPGAGAASGARAAVTGPAAVGEALKKGPVYVDPRVSDTLSRGQADALANKIEKADKPLFVVVLPQNADFPADSVLRSVRTETGDAGLYAIRLGPGFNAGADSQVMSRQAVGNLVSAVKSGGPVNAPTQLNNFVDQALPQLRGTAPASWDAGGGGDGGSPVAALAVLGGLVVVGGAGAFTLAHRGRKRREDRERAELAKLRVVVDEDITAFGEELDTLDFHPGEAGADDAMRADYGHALDAYEKAKARMASARRPVDVRPVTEALEEGRFGLAVLAARRSGGRLPERRPPCFFDPRHGPSVADAEWAPAGGAPRTVPVCAADSTRLADGDEPLSRTVETSDGRRPYWEAGPVYGPWAGGYFGGGLLPGLLAGTLLGSVLLAPGYGYADGTEGTGPEGGDYSGGNFDSGDFGGDGFGGGGGDFGGGGGF